MNEVIREGRQSNFGVAEIGRSRIYIAANSIAAQSGAHH